LMEAGMSAAMEGAVETFQKGMVATIVALPKIVVAAFKHLPTMLSDALASSVFGAMGAHYETKAGQATSLKDKLYYRAAAGLANTGAQAISGYTAEGSAQMTNEITTAIQQAVKMMESSGIDDVARRRFRDMIQQPNDPNQPAPDPAADPFKTGGKRRADSGMEANALERIGFIFGGGNVGMDYAKNTARNTSETVRKIGELTKIISANTRGGSGDWAFTS
jgi:hypothetical protein